MARTTARTVRRAALGAACLALGACHATAFVTPTTAAARRFDVSAGSWVAYGAGSERPGMTLARSSEVTIASYSGGADGASEPAGDGDGDAPGTGEGAGVSLEDGVDVEDGASEAVGAVNLDGFPEAAGARGPGGAAGPDAADKPQAVPAILVLSERPVPLFDQALPLVGGE